MATDNGLFHEIVIIGGSNAGLSAALILGRARRKVLIIDDDQPRNKSVKKAYGFYTRDGTPPGELIRIGREQLEPYDVEFYNGCVDKAEKIEGGFLLSLVDGTALKARKIILATGVKDDLPDLPGLEQLWGKSVFTCPYCDGWELRDKPLAVIGSSDKAFDYTLLIHEWSKDLILCTDGERLSEEHERELQRQNIMVITEKITQLAADGVDLTAIHFEGNHHIKRQAIFMQPPCQLRSDLAKQLGCSIEKNDTQLSISETGQTCVEGVYAAGDAATRLSQVVVAAASGVTTALTLNHDLVQEKLKQ